MKKTILALALLPMMSWALCAQKITWESVPMDGSRTGTVMPGVDNVAEALGVVDGNVYKAPNGTVFRGGATAKAAALILSAQGDVAALKEVVGCCPEGMRHYRPESELSNLIVDCIKRVTEETTGRHVDVALTNMGGIREDLPAGDVQVGDIYAMLPFKNYLCYVTIKGSDLRDMFSRIAGHVEALSGVTMEIKGKKVVKVLVGGKPIDDEKIYGLATIDFLLAGGDGISAARYARELIQTEVLVRDAVLPYLRSLTAAGKPITYAKDGRVKYVN